MPNAAWRFSSSNEYRIAAPFHASSLPSVPFPPATNDARDHRARRRSQARCDTHAPQSFAASPHPEFHGCFHWHWHLFSFGTTFLLFVHALRTFPKLFIKRLNWLMPCFWCCSYFW